MANRLATATLAAVTLSLIALATSPARAFEVKPFDQAAFTAAQSAGQSIVVDVYAPWCPTCKAQHQVFDGLKDKPEFANVTVLQVDFDTQKDALKTLKARQQSTLIAFKGDKETARSAGETDAAKIEALIASTLK